MAQQKSTNIILTKVKVLQHILNYSGGITIANELQVMEKDEQLVVSSIDVAEITGKRHDNLMRDIKGYISTLEVSSDLRASNFFVEGTYIDGSNRVKPCFFLTRKGCDMIANKITGEKGILFTATYVERFYDMENQLKQELQSKLPTTYKEALLALVLSTSKYFSA
ncbi:Rha family transcriptional regulator [Bacillus hominis]|uniref:Rha family transcriptional regulator n=1 Tax=Bacillus hominis TaxID=2817478 RepID=UPI001BB418A4|nr:Rha family transcriptional regulator [Bacillus hominis]